MTDAALQEALNGQSVSEKGSGVNNKALNGKADHSSEGGETSQQDGKEEEGGLHGEEEGDEGQSQTSMQGLRQELARARKERDDFEAQYMGLLGKLTQMRNTLGERLRQDAEELEAKDLQIENLTSETERLAGTVDTLKEELVVSNGEAEKLTSELESLRSRVSQDSNDRSSREQTASLEVRVRELLDESEKLRIDSETLEANLESERAAREEIEDRLRSVEAAREDAEGRAAEYREQAEREGHMARELQSVLEEFQAGQDSELQRALGDYQEKYDRTAQAYEEMKEKAKSTEAKLAEYQTAAERCQSLEKEVKEKNLLIGKLRHEAVILNEHLTEALRRIRNESSDASVDRRLVTNLLLQFLTTPRADAKRFEMLSLIASVLHWSDEERETGGLQKRDGSSTGGGGGGGGSGQRTPGSGRKIGTGVESTGQGGNAGGRGHGRSRAVDGSTPGGGEESFSNLFVEFLLSEAEKAQQQQQEQPQSPGSRGTPASPPLRGPTSPGPVSPGSPSLGSAKRPAFNLDALAMLRRGSKGDKDDSGANEKEKGKAPAS